MHQSLEVDQLLKTTTEVKCHSFEARGELDSDSEQQILIDTEEFSVLIVLIGIPRGIRLECKVFVVLSGGE